MEGLRNGPYMADPRKPVNARELAELYREAELGKRTVASVDAGYRLAEEDIGFGGGLAQGVTQNLRGLRNAGARLAGLVSDDARDFADRQDRLDAIDRADFDSRGGLDAKAGALIGDIGTTLAAGAGVGGLVGKGLRAAAGGVNAASRTAKAATAVNTALNANKARTALLGGAALDGALSLGSRGSSLTAALAGENDGGTLDEIAANPFARAGVDVVGSIVGGKALQSAGGAIARRFRGAKGAGVADVKGAADAAATQAELDALEQARLARQGSPTPPAEGPAQTASAAAPTPTRVAPEPNAVGPVQETALASLRRKAGEDTQAERLAALYAEPSRFPKPTPAPKMTVAQAMAARRLNPARPAAAPVEEPSRLAALLANQPRPTVTPIAEAVAERAAAQADDATARAEQAAAGAAQVSDLAATARQAETAAAQATQAAAEVAQQVEQVAAPVAPIAAARAARAAKKGKVATPTAEAASVAPTSPVEAVAPVAKGKVRAPKALKVVRSEDDGLDAMFDELNPVVDDVVEPTAEELGLAAPKAPGRVAAARKARKEVASTQAPLAEAAVAAPARKAKKGESLDELLAAYDTAIGRLEEYGARRAEGTNVFSRIQDNGTVINGTAVTGKARNAAGRLALDKGYIARLEAKMQELHGVSPEQATEEIFNRRQAAEAAQEIAAERAAIQAEGEAGSTDFNFGETDAALQRMKAKSRGVLDDAMPPMPAKSADDLLAEAKAARGDVARTRFSDLGEDGTEDAVVMRSLAGEETAAAKRAEILAARQAEEAAKQTLPEAEQIAALIDAGVPFAEARSRVLAGNRAGAVSPSVLTAIASPAAGAVAGAAAAEDGERIQGAIGGAAIGAGAYAAGRAAMSPIAAAQAKKAGAKAARLLTDEDAAAAAAATKERIGLANQVLRDSRIIKRDVDVPLGKQVERTATRELINAKNEGAAAKAARRAQDATERNAAIEKLAIEPADDFTPEQLAEIAAGGGRTESTVFERQTVAGTRADNTARATQSNPVYDDAGEIVGFETITRDVREAAGMDGKVIAEIDSANAGVARLVGKTGAERKEVLRDIAEAARAATLRGTVAGRDLAFTRWATDDTTDPAYWLINATRAKKAQLTNAEVAAITNEHRLYAEAVASGDPDLARTARQGLIEAVAAAEPVAAGQQAASLYKSSLLSSLRTQATNLVSTLSQAIAQPLENVVAGQIDRGIARAVKTKRAFGTVSEQMAAIAETLDAKTLGSKATVDANGVVVKPGTGALGAAFDTARGAGKGSSANQQVARIDNAALFGPGRLADTLDFVQGKIFGLMGGSDSFFRSIAATREAAEVMRVMAARAGEESVDAWAQKHPEQVYMLIGRMAGDAGANAKGADDILALARAGGASKSSLVGKQAEAQVFQNETGASVAVESGRARLREVSPTIEGIASATVIPFVRTPFSVLDRVLEYSPILGLAYTTAKNIGRRGAAKAGPDGVPNFAQALEAYRDVMARVAGEADGVAGRVAQAKAERDLVIAQRRLAQSLTRGAVGLGLTAAAAGPLLEAGRLTGAFPTDADERAIWAAEGKQANSILIGGRWVPLMSLGPTGMALAGGAAFHAADPDLAKTGLDINSRSFEERTFSAFGGAAAQVLDNPLASGTDNLRKALSSKSDEDAGERTARLVGGLVPAAVSDLTRAIQPEVRRADSDTFIGSFGQTLGARIPGIASLTPVKRDALGEEMTYGEGLGDRLANLVVPGMRSRAEDSPLLGAAARAGTPIAPLRRNKEKVPMADGSTRPAESPAEFEARVQARGAALTPALTQLLNNPQFDAAPLALRKKAVRRLTGTANKAGLGVDGAFEAKVIRALGNGRITAEQAAALLNPDE